MKRRFATWGPVVLVVLVAALALGMVWAGGKGGGKPPKGPACPNWDLVCPDVWDPVICSDGVTYSNQCYADRACATGCEPAGGGPTPI